MKSLKEFLIIGPGPSSSHTIGPYRAAKKFLASLDGNNVNYIDVTLYSSLALTGKGHGTDNIIIKALSPYKTNIIFDFKTLVSHPNTIIFKAILKNGKQIEHTYFSIGGGAIKESNEAIKDNDIYPFSNFSSLKAYMKENNFNDIYDVIVKFEGKDIFDYAKDLLLRSFNTIEEGIKETGILPGKLKLKMVAKEIHEKAMLSLDPFDKKILLLTSYAYATAEANANGKEIVTAPTCGSSGVVPSVLYYQYKEKKLPIDTLTKGYLVCALIGSFVKENASISGACHGCQAEIGTASSMAAASLCYVNGLNIYQIEYAAEVSMEHFLGLTCDPVDGYVQIPCIERNGIASIHAYTSYLYAKQISLSRKNKVSFDKVIEAMKNTGEALHCDYKETSLGGLAKVIE